MAWNRNLTELCWRLCWHISPKRRLRYVTGDSSHHNHDRGTKTLRNSNELGMKIMWNELDMAYLDVLSLVSGAIKKNHYTFGSRYSVSWLRFEPVISWTQIRSLVSWTKLLGTYDFFKIIFGFSTVLLLKDTKQYIAIITVNHQLQGLGPLICTDFRVTRTETSCLW
jgi:hypothetical protein